MSEISIQNEIFPVNGDISELKETIHLVNNIIEQQRQGQNVIIKDGEVIVYNGKYDQRSLGTLPDLSETTTAIFGDGKVPKEVEYIKMEGITFMTCKGHLIACGDGSNLENFKLKESVSVLDFILSINNFNLSAIPGTGKVFEPYAKVMSVGALQELVELIEDMETLLIFCCKNC